MEYSPDEKKSCVEPNCRIEFLFTESEKSWYQKNGLFEPLRCPKCRKERRLKRERERDDY